MPTYKAPLADFRFLLHEVYRVQDQELPGFAELTPETVDAVLEGAARMAEDVLFPLNQIGDQQGCVYENGVVRTPQGFKQAYDALCAGGWNATGVDPAWGGQGLPYVLGMAVSEMTASANISLSTYPGLTMAAAGALLAFASPEIKKRYVPNMISGRWSGTMNLTEPHCGTDLRLMKTKAVAQADGTYRVTGTKIFITGGEQDLTDNIVHMVLAKIPGPAGEDEGLASVNLFMVPKFLVNDDGTLGPRNGVSCIGIEHKMGIKGSATAQLRYENAIGWRIGPDPARLARKQEQQATQADKQGGKQKSSSANMMGMFAMMNAARLGVGMQGVALAELAYQNAAAYAHERLAGRSLTGAKHPDKQADPIIVHPDVRRMLLQMRSTTEAARAMIMWVALLNAESSRHPDADKRQRAQRLVNLLTPIIKAHFTDLGFESTNLAVQCLGGHGYIRDHGVEQYVRDARILQLYEGANGVQALDLVGRKLGAEGGAAPRELFATLQAEIDAAKGQAELAELAGALQKASERLIAATLWLAAKAPANRDEAGAASHDYLKLMGIVVLGLMWLRMAQAAQAALAAGTGDADFYRFKLDCARYYMARILPETMVHKARIEAGADTLMRAAEASF